MRHNKFKITCCFRKMSIEGNQNRDFVAKMAQKIASTPVHLRQLFHFSIHSFQYNNYQKGLTEESENTSLVSRKISQFKLLIKLFFIFFK